MSSRRALLLALRFGVAALGLVLAFRLALSGSEGGVATLWHDAWKLPLAESVSWFAAAWLLLGLNLAVGALRFRVLLRGAGLEVPLGTLFRAYVVASFFNLVLPGAILGDVYRFWDARRDTGEGSRVFATVVVERVLSVAALGALAVAVSPALSTLAQERALFWTVVLAGSVLVGLAAAFLTPPVNRWLVRGARGMARWSSRVAAVGERALDAAAALAAQPGVVARAFGWSLVNQVLPIAALALLAIPLGAWVPWYWFAVIVPFVTLVSLLPVSVGGTGVRELLYVSLFGAVGMRPEDALALSLSVLAAALSWGLLGVALFGLGRRKQGRRAVEPGL